LKSDSFESALTKMDIQSLAYRAARPLAAGGKIVGHVQPARALQAFTVESDVASHGPAPFFPR
jgi:hypothetical protein